MMDDQELKLCDGIRENEVATRILNECVKSLSDHPSGVPPCISVVLTGSFSRGEGSVLIQRYGSCRVLGDIEFMVVYDETQDLPLLRGKLREVSESVGLTLLQNGISCDVEYSPVHRGYFRRLKPTIFNFELMTHGRVVFGDTSVMGEIPSLNAARIPRQDATNLLGNRIVEQLILYRRLKTLSTGEDFLKAFYQLLKMRLDIAGSFLTFIGLYESSYQARCDAFTHLITDGVYRELDDFLRWYYPLLKEATDFKLNPGKSGISCMSDPRDLEYERQRLQEFFTETIGHAHKLWEWEIASLNERLINHDAMNMSSYIYPLTLAQRFRGWAKIWWIGIRNKYNVSLGRTLSLLRKGTPQILLFAVAGRLYFSLSDGSLETRYLKDIEKFLPVPGRCSSFDALVDDLIITWIKFLRNA